MRYLCTSNRHRQRWRSRKHIRFTQGKQGRFWGGKASYQLHSLLDQQQRLNMSDKSRIELLELEIEEKPDEQKGFFARLFNL